jgi:hypothetical protein
VRQRWGGLRFEVSTGKKFMRSPSQPIVGHNDMYLSSIPAMWEAQIRKLQFGLAWAKSDTLSQK